MWWWDGVRWVLASPAPVAPPPTAPPPATAPPPPPSYAYLPPAYSYAPAAAAPPRSLRVILIVMLAVTGVLSGLMSLAGTIGVTGGNTSAVSVSLWLLFIAIFLLSAGALVGVARRSTWGRWVALAAGMAVCFTCLGAVIGIPIIYAAARAPLSRIA